ncbi:MAG: hypothetical protein Tsb002_01130 [Wenzhouxiangellaceae bacterium]
MVHLAADQSVFELADEFLQVVLDDPIQVGQGPLMSFRTSTLLAALAKNMAAEPANGST